MAVALVTFRTQAGATKKGDPNSATLPTSTPPAPVILSVPPVQLKWVGLPRVRKSPTAIVVVLKLMMLIKRTGRIPATFTVAALLICNVDPLGTLEPPPDQWICVGATVRLLVELLGVLCVP